MCIWGRCRSLWHAVKQTNKQTWREAFLWHQIKKTPVFYQKSLWPRGRTYLRLLSRVRSVAQVTGSCGKTTVSFHKFVIGNATHCEESYQIWWRTFGANKDSKTESYHSHMFFLLDICFACYYLFLFFLSSCNWCASASEPGFIPCFSPQSLEKHLFDWCLFKYSLTDDWRLNRVTC